MKHIKYKRLNREGGAILIVAMVILLVMTTLGMGSRMNTILQQKMSVAYQQKSIATIAAEAGLRAAEEFLDNNITSTNALSSFDDGSLGLYANWNYVGQINTPDWQESALADVVDPDDWDNANSVEVADYDPSVARAPRYVIEYVGQDVMGTSNKVVVDYNDPNLSAGYKPHVFQITAIGWSRDIGIYSVLQTSYRTGNGPGSFTY